MRLCPDDDLTRPTSYGHRHPPGRGTAGADAAVFPAAPALAASAVLKTAATAGRHRTGTHAGGGLRARSPPPASELSQYEGTADSHPPQAPDANINAHVSNCTCLHHHRQNPARLSDNDDSPRQGNRPATLHRNELSILQRHANCSKSSLHKKAPGNPHHEEWRRNIPKAVLDVGRSRHGAAKPFELHPSCVRGRRRHGGGFLE